MNAGVVRLDSAQTGGGRTFLPRAGRIRASAPRAASAGKGVAAALATPMWQPRFIPDGRSTAFETRGWRSAFPVRASRNSQVSSQCRAGEGKWARILTDFSRIATVATRVAQRIRAQEPRGFPSFTPVSGRAAMAAEQRWILIGISRSAAAVASWVA